MFSRDELIRDALALEPLPASSARLTRLLSSDDWTLQDVATTVMLDPALTGTILRYANSVQSGARQEITHVAPAVMRMGPDLVLSLAMGRGLQRRLNTALDSYGMAEGELWKHSVATALAVDVLRRNGARPPAGSFVAALVHDVGKLVIGRKLGAMGIRLTSSDSNEPSVGDEAEQLGIDHAELSGQIAAVWELPAGVPDAVTYHHRVEVLEDGTIKTMAAVISIADAIAHELTADGKSKWDATAGAQLGLSEQSLAALADETAAMLEYAMRMYD